MELEQLRTRLASAMEARGYSQKSINGLASVLNRIRRFSENCHGMDTGAILSRYLKHLDEVGAASGRRRNDASHCIRRLLNLCRGEEISWRVPHVGATPVGPGFEAAIRLIESSETWTSDAVRQNVLSGMRLMFAWMRHRGVSGPSGLTRELVMTYYIEKSSQSRFVKSIRYALKRGLLVSHRIGLVDFDCEAVFRLRIPTRSRLLPAISDEDIARVLASIDRDSPQGSRDYAMILLGADTGLRPVDIVRLRLCNIDWKQLRIDLVQRKTAQPLSVPISRGTADAIGDYVLRHRRRVESDIVFISTKAPWNNLDRKDPGKRFVRYAKMAGLDACPGAGRTFYAMRRRLGARLVESGAALPTVSQALGHRDVRSAESYMSLSATALAGCALSFDGIKPEVLA